MSVNNRVGVKTKAEKFEPETTIENKIDEIKADHMKNIDFVDMKISAITSTKNASYSEELQTNLLQL